MSDPILLNLGCGDQIIEGFVNIDVAGENVMIHDLNTRWPFEDSSVEFIIAHDIFEHLHNKIFTMNEAYRVLRPGSVIEIVVPTTGGPGAFQDPTHVSFWNERSFLYYEKGSAYRERFAKSYGITAAFRTKYLNIEQTQDGPKLKIILEAVK